MSEKETGMSIRNKNLYGRNARNIQMARYLLILRKMGKKQYADMLHVTICMQRIGNTP